MLEEIMKDIIADEFETDADLYGYIEATLQDRDMESAAGAEYIYRMIKEGR